jgi:hypothetical protein
VKHRLLEHERRMAALNEKSEHLKEAGYTAKVGA